MKTMALTICKKVFKTKNFFILLMLLYPLANFLIFYVLVNFNSVLMAFQTTDKNFKSVFAGLENFKNVFDMLKSEGLLIKYGLNSLFFFFASLIIGFPLNMLFAYLFFIKMRGSTFFRFCILLPAMVSGLVTAMLYSKFAENALPMLFDKWFGIKTLSILKDERFNKAFLLMYMLFMGFSSNVIIYTNAMNGLDDSVIEAARVDGATSIRMLITVIMPIIYPTIVIFMVTGFAGIFSLDSGGYLFYRYGAPDNVTTIGYYIFLKSKSTTDLNYSLAAAIGIVFTVITFPLTMGVKALLDKFDPMKDGTK